MERVTILAKTARSETARIQINDSQDAWNLVHPVIPSKKYVTMTTNRGTQEPDSPRDMKSLATPHGPLALPAFLPDATQGVVRCVDSGDLEACGVAALMVNALHLSSRPGVSAIASMGGMHRFMRWSRPIASDSGGFQALSLAAGKLGSVSNEGFTYRFDKAQKKRTLTPETCIRKQFQLGADILFCLDHCTHPDAPDALQRESVAHTIEWAVRCKQEFQRQRERRQGEGTPPLLFAVVQGGANAELRHRCADGLLDIGFDGYGFGGWPVDAEGRLVDMVQRVAELIPASFPKHALGIGKPENLARAVAMGYDLCDCVIPTRDARHKRLYAFTPGAHDRPLADRDFYHCLYMQDDKYARDARPIEEGCDCACCRDYSRAYLHHLFQIGDASALRLATLHNLRFYARLIERLRIERDGAESGDLLQ